MLREATVEVLFANEELKRLYTENVGAEKYSAETVRLFRRRIRHIEASKDMHDLRSAGGVRYSRDSGPKGRCSLALNDAYQLIISEQDDVGRKPIVVHEIARRLALAS